MATWFTSTSTVTSTPVELVSAVSDVARRVTLAASDGSLYFAYTSSDVQNSASRISFGTLVPSTSGWHSISFILPEDTALWAVSSTGVSVVVQTSGV